ncbi:hypothetical protein K9M16_02580 [Candidatus Babeliales bacterium]|nr:hypothetical protein [Candidatus Babeliales bacterium]
MNSLKQKVISKVENIYKHGDIKYAIWNYIERDFWVKYFEEWFPNMYLYNATDFNYSTCFTVTLNISPINGNFLSKNFDNYIEKKGYADLLSVDISVLAPYAIIRYVQYRLINKEYIPYNSYIPFNPEHEGYGNKVKEELEKRRISILEDEILFAKVDPEISLELRTEDVRVYNCLFDDVDGWPK